MRGESGTSDPILCAHLIRRVDEKLIDLLSSLTSSEWDLQTIVPRWKVRDVAAHLLDTALRKLSMARDSCYVEGVDIRSPQDLVTLVDRLNQQGVTVYRRLSPSLLIDLMRVACEQSARFHEALDPFAPARFAVSWAGEETSLNWFDTARELTERWHHQQQIRLATNRRGIMTPDLYHPVLECFVRGLPHVYRDVGAPAGTAVLIEVSGECGGKWCLLKTQARWTFADKLPSSVAAHVTVPQSIAWRILRKGLDPSAARLETNIVGNIALGEH